MPWNDLTTSKDIEDLCKKNNINKTGLRLNAPDELNIHTKGLLCNKPVRSWSGVLVVTVVMKPDKFSCPHDCYYCPNEPGQPRSYLSSEPAVARANEVQFETVRQVHSRFNMLYENGHIIDKIEYIILGGTFSSYSREYRESFISDLYYAANIWTPMKNNWRSKGTIELEQNINETSQHRVVGLCLETRPDYINKYEIQRFRRYGCTRVQIGIQHTDDNILEVVNRGHTNADSIRAVKLLKTNGFKVDMHIMPDMPGSNPIMDKKMIETVLCSKNYSPDYLKIYPCLDTDFSRLREWKQNGLWVPYSEINIDTLIDVILHAKIHSKYYTRFNRIQRDFPMVNRSKGIIGYSSDTIQTNLRQIVQNRAKKLNIDCKCIRCREIKAQVPESNLKLIHIETINTNGGVEKFISCTSPNKKILFGFLRLRFNSNEDIFFKSIRSCAMVRELHVYGFICSKKQSSQHGQHNGVGKTLLALSEIISYLYGYKRIAVISGVGVRKYYAHLGYNLNKDGWYMIKNLSFINFFHNILTIITFVYFMIIKLLNINSNKQK